MGKALVIIGIGEIGGVFAKAFLRSGHPVYPVNRGQDQEVVARMLPEPQLVLISVGEADLQSVLSGMPDIWRSRVVLLQNELLPRDWALHGLEDPTIMSVWFEKKQGRDVKVVVPSPVFGHHATRISKALSTLKIPCVIVENEKDLLFELVRKNLYILVTNICGLSTGGTVGELWADNETLARAVASDVLDVQDRLTGTTLDRGGLIAAMLVSFQGDPRHKCQGRTAARRLQRVLDYGDQFDLSLPTLHRIAGEI
jgi:ketopantoate reductase